MSCGAPKQLTDLVDGINGVIDTVESGISALPKRIASIPGYTEITMGVQVAQLTTVYLLPLMFIFWSERTSSISLPTTFEYLPFLTVEYMLPA